MNKCNICDYKSLIQIDFNNVFLRTESNKKDIHEYRNFLCENCGVLNQYPQMTNEALSKFYNLDYRNNDYKIEIKGKKFDFPLQFEQTGVSFQRFFFFQKIIERANLKLNEKNILDYGSYQGAFLYACKKFYNSYTIGYDHNDNGLRFSKDYLNIDEIYKTKDINSDTFNKKIDMASLIHVFEHLKEPNKFLKHLHSNILSANGFLYIEVPNIETTHLADPTHCFTYSIKSLEFVLKKNNFEIVILEKNNLYNNQKNIINRKFQDNIHCLAKRVDKVDFNNLPLQGKVIYKEVKKSHNIIFNKFIFSKTKEFIINLLSLIILFISKFLSLFSAKISINFFEFIWKIKKYIKRL